MKIDASLIHGTVQPGLEQVRVEFERNFVERGEIGAACCAYHQGRKVVDLWGGHRDPRTRAPWEEDTLVVVYSTTKGLASMAVALAHSRGLLDYEERVAAYWPEFAQEGKENVTVRQLISHQAGLCAIDETLSIKHMADLDYVAWAIAKQKPAWEPGTRNGYHAISLGWYQGELIRRVDPAHRSLGRFFQEEIAGPLGLEFYIGCPESLPDSRVATIKPFRLRNIFSSIGKMAPALIKAYFNPASLTHKTLNNPRMHRADYFNRPDVRRLELPAANGTGQVRSIAKAYGAFACGGRELGIREETMSALTGPEQPPSAGPMDEVLKVNTSYSLGFSKPFKEFNFGTSGKAFGAPGAGGSFAYADPDAEIGFAYAPNRMDLYMWDDPREKSLRDALYRCLGIRVS
ncbi:MAG TPA: serine hydrolase domain-containing protein [Candidatus Brocadiia bacterium]|nr:serine hydrolase domain-containing protein [Candidatus Brocadiia bacterium]